MAPWESKWWSILAISHVKIGSTLAPGNKSAERTMDASNALLKRLCSHVTGISDGEAGLRARQMGGRGEGRVLSRTCLHFVSSFVIWHRYLDLMDGFRGEFEGLLVFFSGGGRYGWFFSLVFDGFISLIPLNFISGLGEILDFLRVSRISWFSWLSNVLNFPSDFPKCPEFRVTSWNRISHLAKGKTKANLASLQLYLSLQSGETFDGMDGLTIWRRYSSAKLL